MKEQVNAAKLKPLGAFCKRGEMGILMDRLLSLAVVRQGAPLSAGSGLVLQQAGWVASLGYWSSA